MDRIEQIVREYSITIVGDKLRAFGISDHPEDFAWLKEHKQEIMDYIRDKERREREALEERSRKIAAIPGLNELQNAYEDVQSWHEEFEKSFEDVGGLGVRPKPEYDFAALNAQYPRAAAYLQAENFQNASHFVKSSAGQKALDKIINGDDYKAAIAEMQATWDSYMKEHIWD